MIRMPKNNQCWQLDNNKNLVELQPCNADSKLQHWIAHKGAVDSKQFELLPVTQQSECGT